MNNMTPLEWVNEAIVRHTTGYLECRIDKLEPEKSDYSQGISSGNALSHRSFVAELHQLKELLVSRPPLTAKEASD